MGNVSPKPKKLSQLDRRWHSTHSQFSYGSVNSALSTASLHRSWSRTPRRRLKHSSLYDVYDSSKTAWPVPITESVFLPEFTIKGPVNETHFEIMKTIARGAFGRVLKVRKKDNKKEYAMKVLYKSQVLLENAVQQCKDEVTIQSSLGHHPFIVKCEYFWQTRKHLFIVTDFVEHGELLSLWKEHGSFPESVVKVYIAELAIAIDFLNNAGVVYRDLKMENILLDKEGHVQLIDFGLAKWLHYGDRARTICGTIQYMAPEILNMCSYSHKVDWWSLGIIMYALLMGHYPIEGVRDHTKMAEIVGDYNYSLPADRFSESARSFLRKLLCKNPSKRLHSLLNMKWEMFYRNFDFEAVTEKKMSPKKLLEDSRNETENFVTKEESSLNENRDMLVMSAVGKSHVIDVFEDFPWVSATEVF